MIARDAEIFHIIQVLQRRIKNNPVLIGASGSGKISIVEELAQHIINVDEVPERKYEEWTDVSARYGIVIG